VKGSGFLQPRDPTKDLLVPGRTCGSCSLCCKVLQIDELQKPVGQWCPNCAVGRGCKIYQTRPSECRTFHCAWLISPDLGEEWQPARAKFVLYSEGKANRIVAHVDPGYPTAWRAEPYYRQLKEWARAAVDRDGQVCVYVKLRTIVILPTRDVDLGELTNGDFIIVSERRMPDGRREWDAHKKTLADIPPEERGKWTNVRGRVPT